MTPQEIFNKAFDILVEHAGAVDGDWQRESFVRSYTTEPLTTEWRFQGTLGFGGKFWRNGGHYYVTYYPEDRTAEREEAVKKVNALLRELPFFRPENLAQDGCPK